MAASSNHPDTMRATRSLDNSEVCYPETSVPALLVTLLGGEWSSSAGGLSTINRELAIHLSNHSAVEVSLLVPEGACNHEEKNEARAYGITIVEAKRRAAFDRLVWLNSPPKDHVMDIVVGHGVKLGRQVQFIRDSARFPNCKWVQVVHTAPEDLSRYKCYSDPISKGETKHESEVELCKLADLVVPVGPRLKEAFYSHLQRCRKDEDVLSITPGLFQREFENLVEKQDPNEDGELKVLLFGLGDDEHFELKGHDIAAKVFCDQRLKNKPYHLIFVGAAEGKQEEVRGKFLQCDNAEAQLTVRKFIQNRDIVKDLLCEAGLAIMPSKSEGFGLFALEALSSGLPILEGSRSGCAEELGNVPRGHTCNVNSDETAEWAKAIEAVRIRPRMRLQGIKLLRSSYREMYNWKEQSEALVNRMWKMGHGTEHLTSVDEDVVLKSSSNSTNSREKLASILEELEAENKRWYETNEELRKLLKAVELVRHLEILAGRNEKKLHSYRQMETTENILKLESDLLRKDQEILTLRNESVDLSCGVCKLRNELETELTELRTSKTPEHDRVAEVVDGRSDSTGSTLLISDVNFELAVNSKSTESFLEKPDKSEFVGDSQMDRNQPSKEQIQQLLIVIDVPQSKKSRMADRNGKLCQILKTPEARSRSPFRLCRSETECLQQEVNIKSAEANTVRKYAPFCSKKANELRSEMAAHRENEACLEKRLYDLEKESAQVRKEMRNGMLEFSELKEKTESVEKKTVDASCVVDRLKEIIRFINDVSTLQREPNVHIDKMSGCLGLDEKGVQQTVTQLHVSVESNDISTQTKESGSEVSSKLSEVFLSSSPFPFRLLPDKEGFLNPIDVSVIRENKTEILRLHDGLNAKVLANSDKACIPKVDDERSGEVHTRAALKNVAVGPKNTSGLPRLSKAERVKFSSFLSICNRTTKNDGRSSGDGNDLCLLYENLEGKLSWLSCELLTKENESTDFLSERTQLQNELEECENGLTVCLHCNCKVSPELEQNRKRLKGGLLSQAQDTSRLESEICEFMECRQRLEGELDLIKGQITNLEDELGCYINREMHWTEARRGRKGNY